ncbi:uridine diphosphate-N-acetylglucosamine [Ordospora colligata]|uniref:UDP-galactose transporter homolog 1 n=1 Tax=Ordospora colligata OC4 TaxID=1354746 RepID=A0A0B2UKX5_9MICR|nr:uridine diphosphate-N-acetylglucosamine [Ordospora colligata OC4]KHN69904.1 uridine diphosphate-N-acetylglucosamine [Ordospora colligata OC4]TBU16074.1 uridine diphosphate-N-acetylglucosamine [Ordospora colligata]TBU16287.1 uridine diphosphate-N-acetylglucosamine [Ordospora colligata]TBU18991.1 uridine diphosphate-N-acetylglucosamine [Ordospora colligata]
MALNRYASLALHTAGIYAFFIVFGVFGEKIATGTYAGRRYKSILFPILPQSFGGILFGRYMMRRYYMGKNGGKMCKRLMLNYVCLALLSILSLSLGILSLKYLSYPTLVIAKSCKLVPIALINILVYRRRMSYRKCLSLCLVSVCVVLFSLLDGSKRSGSGTSVLGGMILVLSLAADGFINSQQDYAFAEFKVSPFDMMYYTNVFRFLIALVLALKYNSIWYTIEFVRAAPAMGTDLLLHSTFNVIGQSVVYSMVQKHGSLNLTMVNVTRKMLSIFVSLVVFGHTVSRMQIACVVGVVASIGLEIIEPKSKKQSTEEKEKNE